MHTPERCQGLKIVGGELRAHQLDCSMESCRAPLPRPCLEHLGWRCGSSSSSSSRPPSPNLRPRTTETPHLYSAPWLLKETGACTEKAARHKTLAGPARGAVRAGGRTPRAARAGRRREGERARPPGCAPCLQDEHDEDEQDEDEDQGRGRGGRGSRRARCHAHPSLTWHHTGNSRSPRIGARPKKNASFKCAPRRSLVRQSVRPSAAVQTKKRRGGAAVRRAHVRRMPKKARKLTLLATSGGAHHSAAGF
ncbi:unnamed protein product [Prorocentrum cordatum]|uniref:Uncharacterized protein n=1 Tax=Prorocentrum cordatum TaxID=2364126 RepID=A0ABN9V6W0_9DINO|nr:unnamed protein product [Polarella glacialis]